MNPLVRKEIRLMLPAWIAGLGLAIVPIWLFPEEEFTRGGLSGLACYTFALAAMLPSLAMFGQEFGLGTFQVWLSQPVPRRRLWWMKITVLAVGLVLLLAAEYLSYAFRTQTALDLRWTVWDLLGTSTALLLVVSCGALWTTLLLRQISMALWVTILMPVVFLYAVGFGLRLILRYSEPFPEAFAACLMVLYAIASFVFARRLFHRTEDVQWTGGTIVLPWRRAARSNASTSSTTSSGRRGTIGVLFKKEFRFQYVSFLVAALLFLLHLAGLVMRKMHSGPKIESSTTLLLGSFLLYLVLPYVIGSMAVAEERRLGTWESFLTLPVRRTAQFCVKYATVLALSIVLCAVVPWVVESVGLLWGLRDGPIAQAFGFKELLLIGSLSAAAATVSFYVSTLTRNTLQALGVAFFANAPILSTNVWLFGTLAEGRGLRLAWQVPLVVWVVVAFIAVCVIVLARMNFSRSLVSWTLWLRNAVVLVMTIGAALGANAFIYNRSWENFMTLEPPHRSAELKGTVRPAICGNSRELLSVLLPDGRLWAASKYELRTLDQYEYVDPIPSEKKGRWEKIQVLVPTEGMFVGGSNWITTAASHHEACGIQSDGTLWRFLDIRSTRKAWANRSVPVQLKRVGVDSDWKALASGSDCFFGLKTDGSLWAWGNWSRLVRGQSYPQGDDNSEPVQIGKGSDWTAIYAAQSAFVGVKRDGSVWVWGDFPGRPESIRSGNPAPILLPIVDGSRWIDVHPNANLYLALADDKSLWAYGNFPDNILGYRFSASRSTELLRVGSDSHWADVSIAWGPGLLAVKQDGTLIENDMEPRSVWTPRVRRLSKYSDWIAVSASWKYTALAADGTLSCWVNRWPDRALLGPSREPAWSVNILSGNYTAE